MNVAENNLLPTWNNTYPTEHDNKLEEEGIEIEDSDTCSLEELGKFFKHKYKIHDQTEVTYDNSYVLALAKDDSFTCIVSGLSDGSVRLFEINSERGIYIIPPEKSKMLGVRFLDETANLLLIGTSKGLVRLLDLRIRKEVMRFVNNPKCKSQPLHISSFDRNSTSRLLAMGTVQCGNNVNLLFYDFRTSKEMFRYTESHQDDVTSLCFHPQNPDILCTGSTDSLINIFNVMYNEDNAILTTVNTGSSVDKINWHINNNGKDIVSCITHTNEFKAYDFGGDIIVKFDRLKLTDTIKRSNESNCNLINCHSIADNKMMLLTGCNSNNGSVLRSCTVQNKQLQPYAIFEGNEQIVRESIFDKKNYILITAGERGFVTLWTVIACNSTAPHSVNSVSCA